jgi:hypothetical protein
MKMNLDIGWEMSREIKTFSPPRNDKAGMGGADLFIRQGNGVPGGIGVIKFRRSDLNRNRLSFVVPIFADMAL